MVPAPSLFVFYRCFFPTSKMPSKLGISQSAVLAAGLLTFQTLKNELISVIAIVQGTVYSADGSGGSACFL